MSYLSLKKLNPKNMVVLIHVCYICSLLLNVRRGLLFLFNGSSRDQHWTKCCRPKKTVRSSVRWIANSSSEYVLRSTSPMVWFFLLLAVNTCAAYYTDRDVDIYDLTVPRYPKAGSDVQLRCHFHLHGTNHGLYTVNWWRGKDQFYTYKANSPKPKHIFMFRGIRVNVENSTADTVSLKKVSEQTSGLYRCEVMGEGPAFKTAVESKRMTVIIPPEKLEIFQPSYRGHPNYYDIGDMVELNCSAYNVKPRPILQWHINGKTAQNAVVKRFPDVKDSRGRISATLQLQFLAAQHFINKKAVVTCSALVEGHKFHVEEHLRLNPAGEFYLYSSRGNLIPMETTLLWILPSIFFFQRG